MTPSSAGDVAEVLLLVAGSLVLWPSAQVIAGTRLCRLTSRAPRLSPRAGDLHRATGPGRWGDGGSGNGGSGSGGSGGGGSGGGGSGGGGSGRGRAAAFAAALGAAILVSFPTLLGGSAGMVAAAGCYVLLRGPARVGGTRFGTGAWLRWMGWPDRAGGRGSAADPVLPLAIELLAVCLRSGLSTAAALRSVSNTLPRSGPTGVHGRPGGTGVGEVLTRAAAATELGSDPASAWQDWIGDPVYGRLARAMVVTGESGSAIAGRLNVVSGQLRAEAGQLAVARVQRVGVTLMAPLGLCFLPAFVCLGVVPVVVGIAGQVFP